MLFTKCRSNITIIVFSVKCQKVPCVLAGRVGPTLPGFSKSSTGNNFLVVGSAVIFILTFEENFLRHTNFE